jgi:hypothetical protein
MRNACQDLPVATCLRAAGLLLERKAEVIKDDP